jgi:alpha-tubulin suppressor-like RCC1 family protein
MSRATGRAGVVSRANLSPRLLPALVLASVVVVVTMAAAGPASAASSDAGVESLTTTFAAPALVTSPGVLAWGAGGVGELGNATTSSSDTPVAVSGLSGVTRVAPGSNHSLALLSDGMVMAWGANGQGQLGDGTSTGPEECGPGGPCSDTPVPVSGLSGITDIAAGGNVSLALLSNGTVMAWGNNGSGQLGTTGEDSDVPVPVSGLSGVTAIAAGDDYCLALLSNGTVMAWGANNINGELGDGTTLYSLTPVAVKGLSEVTAIAAGYFHALALLKNGTVMAWGDNEQGELGNHTTTSSDVPVAVGGLSGVTAIAAGFSTSLALLSNGTVMGWGYNEGGALGDGTNVRNSDVPVPVSGVSGVMAIAAGGHDALALLSGGTVMAWGQNDSGQLGDGSSTGPETCPFGELCSTTPVPVSGLTGVSAIADDGSDGFAVSTVSTVAEVEPDAGPFVGGTHVTITGTHFIGVTAVKFGSANAAQFTVHSPTSISAVSPAGAGTVVVSVITPVGASVTALADHFSYEPTVTEMQPSDGPPAGGTHVTITGTNFTGATAVKFGSENATKFTVHSATSITAVSPAGAGTVYVTVTTPGGTTALGAADQFTYRLPGEWTTFPSAGAGSNNSLNGVSCISAKHCVAVGGESGLTQEEALIESWNGSAWSIIPTPAVPKSGSSLYGVSCVSAKFCMAVGEQYPVCPCRHPTTNLVETWNGRAWSVVPSPRPPGPPFKDSLLTGVSCVSVSFCVAVGVAYPHSGGPSSTLVESWNGSVWSIAPDPNPGISPGLQDVSCVSIRFCVTVGNFLETLFSGHSLVESWNGTEWSVVASPDGGGLLHAVSCVSAKRCVAVGNSAAGTLVEAWNGSTWSVLESPNPEGNGRPRLSGVSCVSVGSCAAVGYDSTEEGPSQTLVEKSTGSKWSIVPSANSASGVSYLHGVSCVSTESCFAVGKDEATPDGPFQTLVEDGRL